MARSPDSREIQEVCARARAAWPDVELDAATFAAFLDERAPDAAFDALHLDDLYLACACARGDPRAIERVEAAHLSGLGPALGQLEQSGVAPDDVIQLVRVRLFTGEGDRRPAIGQYGGRSPLGGWIKVVAVRIGISLGRKHRREVAVGDEVLGDVPAEAASPELALLKETYRAEFKAALDVAFRSLSPRERNLLRHQVLDGMSIDRIAALYGVHRATAARWVARAREALVRAVKRELQSKLGVDREELDSILRLVRSQLDVSLRLFLATPR